jgi:transcriptional regulator with XRE-family HTH domain
MLTGGDRMARNARRQFARRLRELREFELGEKLTQEELANAFSARRSLSGAAVSTWENGESDKRPSDSRLLQYALLFSSPEHLKPKPHVPSESTLDKEARQQFYELRRELHRLREEADHEARRERSATAPAATPRNDVWHHERSADIMVVTSQIPDDALPDNARAHSVNYSRLARYGNVDAFFELYVKLAAMGYQNRHHRSADDRGIDLDYNLVLVGGPSFNRLTRTFLQLLDVPFSQDVQPRGNPEYFVLADGTEVRPHVADFPDGEQELVEDVGLFVRAANPTNPDTDVTICSGCYTAGSLAAVRAFTHADVAQPNIDAIRGRIGQVTDFFALFRVPVVNGRIPPPRLASSLIECTALR